jgi:5-methyltetrahydrofolate--homocysteine methyltransferase
LLQERLVFLDGAMGTMIQRHKLARQDFRGERFADWRSDLRGNNDLLSSRSRTSLRNSPRLFARGRGCRFHQYLQLHPGIAGDYGMESLIGEINLTAARLARQVADEVGAETGRQRFVAGALGPTSRTASLVSRRQRSGISQCHFDELVAGYSRRRAR